MRMPASIPVAVTLAPASRRVLRGLEKRFPRTMRAAFGAAATRAQNRLRKVMRQAGGVYGVPRMAAHHEISTYLRPGQKMGGILAEKHVIVKYKVDADTQYIGWPDGLARWASNFQDQATRPFTDGQRRWMHHKGLRDVPTTYQRPERDVIDSFASNLAAEWPGMVLERFNYYYRRNMAKYGSVK